jgi:hypothetical protein
VDNTPGPSAWGIFIVPRAKIAGVGHARRGSLPCT